MENESNKCRICHSEILAQESKSECPYCNYYFHFNHLREWLKTKGTCPTCKEKISEDKIINDPGEIGIKDEFFFCSTCGSKNFQSASFCFQCGKAIIFPSQTLDSTFSSKIEPNRGSTTTQIPKAEIRKITLLEQISNKTINSITLSEVFLLLDEVYSPWKYDLQGDPLINWDGTFLFEIIGDNPQLIIVYNGRVTVKSEKVSDPSCSVTIDKETLIKIFEGKISFKEIHFKKNRVENMSILANFPILFDLKKLKEIISGLLIV